MRHLWGWTLGILALWGDELRVVASGRRHLLRRVLLIGALQAVGLRLLADLVPGFQVASWGAALLAAAAIALLNAGLWPVLLYLTLPLSVLTFGLFAVLVNAGLLLLAARLVPGVALDGVRAALWSGVGLAAINTVVSILFDASDDESFYRQVVARAARRGTATPPGPAAPGLVIVQIDGLAGGVLEFAVRTGLMPTLARWLRRGSHRVVPWECALPSQTSASQAGLLYGDNFDIPAFRWYEKDARRLMVSNRPADAAEISRRLSRGRGLLSPEGSSVSNLLSGDAERSALTISALGVPERRGLRSADVLAYFLDPYTVSRALLMSVWEILVELWQAHRAQVRDVQPRIDRGGAFPVLRAVACVLLRDLTTALVLEDLYRGVPVIYTDYVAYDELAHHAGPERPEALNTLAEIDRQIAALERAARGAARQYQFVVLSDHGQSQGATFRQRYGLTLEALVRSLMGPGASVHHATGAHEGWGHVNTLLSEVAAVPSHLVTRLLRRLLRRRLRDGSVELGPDRGLGPGLGLGTGTEAPADVVVCASGNLGLVYLASDATRLSREAIDARYPGLIDGLVAHPGVGLVLVGSSERGPVVVGRDGVRYLADDRVEGSDPLARFGPHACAHLRRLDTFPHVGDLVVVSQLDVATGEVAAFEELVGSHGGLGGPQTSPFLVFPAAWEPGDGDLVGAPAVHGLLQTWRDHLGCATGRQRGSISQQEPSSP